MPLCYYLFPTGQWAAWGQVLGLISTHFKFLFRNILRAAHWVRLWEFESEQDRYISALMELTVYGPWQALRKSSQQEIAMTNFLEPSEGRIPRSWGPVCFCPLECQQNIGIEWIFDLSWMRIPTLTLPSTGAQVPLFCGIDSFVPKVQMNN